MKSHPAPHNSGHAQRSPRQRLPYFWVWLTVALIAFLLMLVGHSAAAQAKRGIEVIELAMTLDDCAARLPDKPAADGEAP